MSECVTKKEVGDVCDNTDNNIGNNRIKLAAVVGATASGKTALSVELAKRFGGEIISCDSMQVYRRMNIGTAKPSEAEKCGIPHHMIDTVEPDTVFSCADYAVAAKSAIAQICGRGRLPILCGGTGLYLDSVLRSGSFEVSYVDEKYRAELAELAVRSGNGAVYELLCNVDPISAASIHPNNLKRVIRALEIYRTTGVTKTELDRRSRQAESPYDVLIIGLRYNDRELLYRRIDERVDAMIAAGLENEVRELYEEGMFMRSPTASQAIGYKELLGYIRGDVSFDCAIDNLKKATRHYAKRQMTWFGAHSDVRWIDADANGQMRRFADIVSDAENMLEVHLAG